MTDRIAITGVGVLSPAGAGPSRLYRAMLRGQDFFGTSARGRPLPWATSLLGADPVAWPDTGPFPGVKKYANQSAHLSVAVAQQALAMRGRAFDGDPFRGGTVMAVSSSGGEELSEVIPQLAVEAQNDRRALAKFLYDKVPDYSYIRGIPSQMGQFVAMANGFRGSNVAVYGETGVNGLGALALAVRMIRSGELNTAMVVGVSPRPSVANLATLDREDALAEKAAPGAGPFDIDRNGVLVGHGAAALLLERVQPNSAPALAFLDDCQVITAPTRRQALSHAVAAALACAKHAPSLWWAHAAGSVLGDRLEYEVVHRHAQTPSTSSKGTIGHAFESGALIDIALAAQSLGRHTAPPVGLVSTPDPTLTELDLITGRARKLPVTGSALVTSLNHGDSSGSAGAALISTGEAP